MTLILVVVALVVVLGLFVAVAFNKLRKADITAQEALGGIDVQLTRRADLIPNLVETVKGYAGHEKAVFEEVTQARAAAAGAARGSDVAAKAAAEQQLDQALVKVLAVAEAYPDLKASATFESLQVQLADTEDQLSFARQYYNDAVARLNTLVRTIPWMLFTGMAGVREREFYEAPGGHEIPPSVQF
ncbi:MAG: LemA family protein [Nocardioides sp.]|nr:LemA family protein [Nocardioides sp.]